MYGVVDKPGVASAIFTALADANINVDMIVQTRGLDGTTDLDFTIPTTDLEICKKVMEQFRPQAKNIDYNEAICKSFYCWCWNEIKYWSCFKSIYSYGK